MTNQLEQLLNRQIELIAKLQAKAEEVLGLDTSIESAEVTAEYFQALESAADSLEKLSNFYEYYEGVDLAGDEGNGTEDEGS